MKLTLHEKCGHLAVLERDDALNDACPACSDGRPLVVNRPLPVTSHAYGMAAGLSVAVALSGTNRPFDPGEIAFEKVCFRPRRACVTDRYVVWSWEQTR